MDNTDSQMFLKNVGDAIGKRLTAVVDSADFSRMLLVFDDGSKCQLSISRGYESGDEMLASDREFDSEYYNKDLLLKAGVVDINWIAEYERKRQEVRRRDSWTNPYATNLDTAKSCCKMNTMKSDL